MSSPQTTRDLVPPTSTQVPEPEDIRARGRVLKVLGQEEAGGRIACTSLLTCSARLQGKTPGTYDSTSSQTTDPADWQRPQETCSDSHSQDALKHIMSQQALACQHRCRERWGAGRPAALAVTGEGRVERRFHSDLGGGCRADRGRGSTSPA